MLPPAWLTARLRFPTRKQSRDIRRRQARLEVEALEILVGPLLEGDDRDEIDTLGGLVCSLAGRVPGRSEVVRHPSGLQFEILDGDPRRITLVKIRGITQISAPPSD